MNTDSHFDVKVLALTGEGELPEPVQKRSRETAGRFIAAAMDLLRTKTYAELSVSDLGRAAGRSVGVFYQRFNSKDDFLNVLLAAFFEESIKWRRRIPLQATPAETYRYYLKQYFSRLMEHRNLWHAALQRSATDPAFWRIHGSFRQRIAAGSREAIEETLGRPLQPEEYRRLRVAAQVFNSVINNQIINGPGPLRLEDDGFFSELADIALSVARLPER